MAEHLTAKLVRDLVPGDVLDPAAVPHMHTHRLAAMSYATVSAVEHETPECTLVHFEDVFESYGLPADMPVVVLSSGAHKDRMLQRLKCYISEEDVDLTAKQQLALVADRIQDDLRDATWDGGGNSNNPGKS